MRLLLVLLALVPVSFILAQRDTVYTYFDTNKKVTLPEMAVYVSKTVKEYEKWHKQVFIKSSGTLYMDGYFADEHTHVPEGTIKYYKDSKRVTDSCFFVNGRLISKHTFYANGQVKSYILFTDSIRIAEQGGYTADGHKIDDYTVWRPAMYPDSTAGWEKYIRRKTSWHLPRGYLNGTMEGGVEISFTIDTTGAVIHATIIKKSGFIDLDQRALAIVEKSRKWLPAIVDNHAVASTQKQTIIFVNNEINAQANKTINFGFELFNWMR